MIVLSEGNGGNLVSWIPWNKLSTGQAAPSVRTPGEVKLLVVCMAAVAAVSRAQ